MQADSKVIIRPAVFRLFVVRLQCLIQLLLGKSGAIVPDRQDPFPAVRVIIGHDVDLFPGIAYGVGKHIFQHFHDQAVVDINRSFGPLFRGQASGRINRRIEPLFRSQAVIPINKSIRLLFCPGTA